MLPKNIVAKRIGHWSYGPESEYDADGELAPITWSCACGARLKLETLDRYEDCYIPVAEEVKNKFLADHSSCEITCYKCSTAPVDRQGDWCQPCEEYSYSRPDWMNECDDPSQEYEKESK